MLGDAATGGRRDSRVRERGAAALVDRRPRLMDQNAAMPRPELSCSVATRFLPDQSSSLRRHSTPSRTPSPSSNTGEVTAQVIGRHWVITHGSGQVEEVRGLGVVGQQPLLQARRAVRVHQLDAHRHPARQHARRAVLHDRRGRVPSRRSIELVPAGDRAGVALRPVQPLRRHPARRRPTRRPRRARGTSTTPRPASRPAPAAPRTQSSP